MRAEHLYNVSRQPPIRPQPKPASPPNAFLNRFLAPPPLSLDMGDAFPLTDVEIKKRCLNPSLSGNYAFGELTSEGFRVDYVGRFDSGTHDRIKHGIGRYSHFKFSYATSPQAAFEKECRNYHDFSPPDNAIHPARPSLRLAKCPRCSACG